jgi:hypothetical protein
LAGRQIPSVGLDREQDRLLFAKHGSCQITDITVNSPTTDHDSQVGLAELNLPPLAPRDRDEAPGCRGDESLLPSLESIREEIARVGCRELSPELRSWVEQYARVGARNPYLWKWCCRGVEVTTLPCVPLEAREELCDTKVLGVMLDVLLDDVADHRGDADFLEHLISLLDGRADRAAPLASAEQRAYAEFATEVWNEIQRRVRRYPHFDEYAELLRFDYLQLLNTMRYSRLVNQTPALLNTAEHDLYLPHNMHMMVSATIDLMCSPGFDPVELGLVREAVWHAQCMGRIGNLVTTWQRELGEGDYTSGVFGRAVCCGDLTIGDLLAGDRERIEAAVLKGDHERHFLDRWRRHRRCLISMAGRVRSVDLEQLAAGLDRLICLHLGSRGRK